MSHTYDLRSNGLGGTREPAGTHQNGSTRPTSRPSASRLAAQLKKLNAELEDVKSAISEQVGLEGEDGLDRMRFASETPDPHHARQNNVSTDPGVRTSRDSGSQVCQRRGSIRSQG